MTVGWNVRADYTTSKRLHVGNVVGGDSLLVEEDAADFWASLLERVQRDLIILYSILLFIGTGQAG